MKDDKTTEVESFDSGVIVSPPQRIRHGLRYSIVGIFAFAIGAAFTVYGPILLNKADRPRNPDGVLLAPLWDANSPVTFLPLALLGAIVGVGLGNGFYRLCLGVARRWDRMDIADKVTLLISVFFGIIAAIPFLILFREMLNPLGLGLAIFGLVVGFISLAAYALQSMEDILPWYKNRVATKRSGIKILDTNVIIDARVYDVARTGFLEGEIYVPNFVLQELQHIADHHDDLKRQRGRRGLEVLKHLQAEFPMEVGKYDYLAPDVSEPVDSRLVRIAKAIGADIVTNDWNLNSVAKLQNVKILSLNELALTLRPTVLPSETLALAIIREGNQPGQGVGYLDDGTMVVVENGKAQIGKTVEVTVTQVIQTERGKMIFAEVDPEDDDDNYTSRPQRRR